jgi:hypothetical protein
MMEMDEELQLGGRILLSSTVVGLSRIQHKIIT